MDAALFDGQETWTCKTYGVTMLAHTAKEFCAKRHETMPEDCGDCSRGALYHQIKGDTMPKKPCTTKDCGRTSQKDDLCYKCYVAKHGKPPYPSQGKNKKGVSRKGAKAAKKIAATAKTRSGGGVIISLDLSQYPALQEHIEEKAREEFRTVEMQAVFMLSKAVEQ